MEIRDLHQSRSGRSSQIPIGDRQPNLFACYSASRSGTPHSPHGKTINPRRPVTAPVGLKSKTGIIDNSRPATAPPVIQPKSEITLSSTRNRQVNLFANYYSSDSEETASSYSIPALRQGTSPRSSKEGSQTITPNSLGKRPTTVSYKKLPPDAQGNS